MPPTASRGRSGDPAPLPPSTVPALLTGQRLAAVPGRPAGGAWDRRIVPVTSLLLARQTQSVVLGMASSTPSGMRALHEPAAAVAPRCASGRGQVRCQRAPGEHRPPRGNQPRAGRTPPPRPSGRRGSSAQVPGLKLGELFTAEAELLAPAPRAGPEAGAPADPAVAPPAPRAERQRWRDVNEACALRSASGAPVHPSLGTCRRRRTRIHNLCVPRTLSLPPTSTFAASRRRDKRPQPCQHDRALWPSDSRT